MWLAKRNAPVIPGRSGTPLWPLILALIAPPLLFVILLSSVLLPSRENSDDLWVGESDFGPTSAAAPAEVEAVHDALHDIGKQCLTPAPDSSAIAASTELIAAFAQKYPTGRFAIDDETATASSLLVVTREALKDCAPESLQRIEAELESRGTG